MALHCSGQLTQVSETEYQCSEPFLVQPDELAELFAYFFAFDPALYAMITSGILLVFVISWGAGIGVKTLSRM